MNKDIYNPTCAITDVKYDLYMHAIRNSKGEMIGWFFINKDIDPKRIHHKIKYQ